MKKKTMVKQMAALHPVFDRDNKPNFAKYSAYNTNTRHIIDLFLTFLF